MLQFTLHKEKQNRCEQPLLSPDMEDTTKEVVSSIDNDENPSVPHVLIIGGGVAGCALALFLKRGGYSSTIFEAYPRDQAIAGRGAGLQVASNGMKVLDSLGLVDALHEAGVISHRFRFYNRHGDQVTSIEADDYRPPSSPSGVNMTRAALHHVLIDEIERQGIPILFEKRLVSLKGFEEKEEGEEEGRKRKEKRRPVIACFEDGSEARGDVVVGADGAHSIVRKIVLKEEYQEKMKDDDEGEDPFLEYLGLMSSGGFVQSDLFLDSPEEEQGTLHFFMGPKGRMFGYCRPATADPRLIMWWRNTYVGYGGQESEKDSDNSEV